MSQDEPVGCIHPTPPGHECVICADKERAKGSLMKFAAEIKAPWDHGRVGTALSEWCQRNPSSAAQLIERLRDQSSARLKIINKKLAEIDQWQMIVVNLESQIKT